MAPEARSIALYLDGADAPDLGADGSLMIDDDFRLLVNAWWEPLDFTIPPRRPGQVWYWGDPHLRPGADEAVCVS